MGKKKKGRKKCDGKKKNENTKKKGQCAKEIMEKKGKERKNTPVWFFGETQKQMDWLGRLSLCGTSATQKTAPFRVHLNGIKQKNKVVHRDTRGGGTDSPVDDAVVVDVVAAAVAVVDAGCA